MKIQIFTIPIVGGEEENSLMNNFLSSHRVIDVQQIVAEKYWTFCVRYVDKVSGENGTNNSKKEKTDYKKVLDENTFVDKRDGSRLSSLFGNDVPKITSPLTGFSIWSLQGWGGGFPFSIWLCRQALSGASHH